MIENRELNRMLACVAELSSYYGGGAGKGATIEFQMRDKYGYTCLGSGHFSAVFEHPTDDSKVVKIGFDVKDSWIGFALYTIEHPAPVFPAIDSLDMYPKYYVAVMEKLTAFRKADCPRLRGQEFPATNLERAQFARRLHRCADDMFNHFGIDSSDLHSGNFMVRGSQIVITDPFACREMNGYEHKKYIPTYGKVNLVEKWKKDHELRLAELREGIKARREEEDQALRHNAEHVHKLRSARMAVLLSPMRNEGLRAQDLLAKPRRDRGLRDVWGCGYRENARGREDRLRGRRPDFIFVDELAAQGRDQFGAKEAVLNRMEREIWEGRAPDLRNWFHADFAALERRVIAQAWDGGAEIHTGLDKPKRRGVPEFRRAHWERGNKLPRGLRYNGGRAKRDQSGEVCSGCGAARDELRAGEVRPRDKRRWASRTCCRAVGRPGQGRADAQQEAGAVPNAARAESCMAGFT